MSSPARPAAPTRFADLPHMHEHVVDALATAGITNAFPIQAAVLPEGGAGRDVLVKSPTGSGKTLAFGLSLIAQLRRGGDRPLAVILVPSRELAVQVRDELAPIAWSKQLRTTAVFGGAPAHKQAKAAQKAAIVVATPGRLADLMRTRRIDVRQVQMLVLDEADRMLDMGFAPQVQEIVDGLPKRRQTMLFSATLEGKVGTVAEQLTSDPVRIERDDAPGAGGEIEHVLVSTTPRAKTDALLELLDEPERDLAVVFVRTQKGCDNLTDRLHQVGMKVTKIHGGMTQQERMRQFRRFNGKDCDVLVATDVFSRGMDLDRITHVVNYELPEDADAFRHRAGRTGRAGRSGTAFTLVTPKQRSIVRHMLKQLDLPLELLRDMREGSTERRSAVAPEQRHVDQRSRDEQRPRAKDRSHNRATARPADRGRRAERSAGSKSSTGRGTIINYDSKKGYGFIRQAAGGRDVFFHRRSLGDLSVERSLRKGLPVEYGLDATADSSKLRAAKVAVRGARG